MGFNLTARRRKHLHRRRPREYSRSVRGREGQCPDQQHENMGNRDAGRSGSRSRAWRPMRDVAGNVDVRPELALWRGD
jgi:hypothetical protein